MDMIEEIIVKRGLRASLAVVTIATVEEAVEMRHIGGPTVQIDGLDIEPGARDSEAFALA